MLFVELTERCHCHYSSEISNGRSAFLLLIRVILALIFCCPRYHMVAYWHFNVGLEFFTSLSDSSCGGNYWILFFFFFGLVWFFSHTFVYAMACSEQAVEETTANQVKFIKYAIGKLSSYDHWYFQFISSCP